MERKDATKTPDGSVLAVVLFVPAGLPALQGGEPGQVRKEAATAIYCKCRGLGSPLLIPQFAGFKATLLRKGNFAFSLRSSG